MKTLLKQMPEAWTLFVGAFLLGLHLTCDCPACLSVLLGLCLADALFVRTSA